MAYWIGKSHVRGAQLGLERAVREPDGGVDDALRVDHHLDRAVVDIVQPVRLDDLQALVGERRGVDGDLGSHGPGRVLEGTFRGDRRHVVGGRVEERTPGCGQDERRDRRHGFPHQTLPDRGMFRIDRPQPGQRTGEGIVRRAFGGGSAASRRASGITRWPPATRVSLLAVATTLPARSAARTEPQAHDPAGRDHDEVHVVARRELASASSVAPRAVTPGPRRRACSASSSAFVPAASATTRNAPGMRGEDVHGLASDRAGRPQQRDPARLS